jgi:threonine/homoserine/homoserine lactone efflux protein
MPRDLWLTFVAASTALLLIPGPTVLLVLSCALSRGRSVAVALASGVALNALVPALLADRLRALVGRPRVVTGLTRAGGIALVGMGVATAILRRPA